jgi:hypothetical protein
MELDWVKAGSLELPAFCFSGVPRIFSPFRAWFNPNAEDHSQKETEATEAEGLPNGRMGISSSGHFALQAVCSLLALFSPVNPIPVFRLNPAQPPR